MRHSRTLVAEPTGNLDTKAGDEIAGLLRHISDDWDRTILMVTHDPPISAYADRIVFLKDGKIADDTWLSGEGHGNSTSAQVRERMDAP